MTPIHDEYMTPAQHAQVVHFMERMNRIETPRTYVFDCVHCDRRTYAFTQAEGIPDAAQCGRCGTVNLLEA